MSDARRRAGAVGVLAAGTLLSGLGVRGLAEAVAGPPPPPWVLPEPLRARHGVRPVEAQPESKRGGAPRPGRLRPVLIVTPDCPWCRQELAMWRQLAASGQVVGSALPSVFMVSDSAPGPLLWNATPRGWARRIEREAADRLGIRRVPTTLWADAFDTVRHIETGLSRADAALRLLREGAR
jgi:hypothetical protein